MAVGGRIRLGIHSRSSISLRDRLGHQVVQASDGQLGLNTFDSEDPDLIVTDLLMPNMDGFQMIEELNSKGCQKPIIVLSADIQKTSNERVREMGVYGKLDKPPSKTDLVAMVEEALR